MPKPELVSNLTQQDSHGAALEYLVGDESAEHPCSVATGYVNLGGLAHLAVTVTDGRGVRLMLGAAPDPGLDADLPMARFERALRSLAHERDLARFPPSRAAQQLLVVDSWLGDPTVEVRRYVSRFLHGKAYLFGTVDDPRVALVTSANLTAGGLFSNLELGLARYDPGPVRQALEWFDLLWAEATDYKDELRRLLFPDPGLVEPETVFLRALFDLYGDELEDELPAPAVRSVHLADFQKKGYERARGIVARHHGVIYADGVGTGKTEIGLAFVEEYALRRGHHALVVTPAQLKGNWEARIAQARLPAQVVSYQELASDEQLVPGAANVKRRLHNDMDSYRLVVVDEGHALRNPDTTWHRAMERLLGGERKDLVLLTATPINNGLWDLYHLVMIFARHDRAFAAYGIPSVRDLFVRAGANERDPENLDPNLLFPLADAVSVRRDRRFIQEHYSDAVFPDGTSVRFPEPHLSTERYDLDDAHPGLVDAIASLIRALTMARYRPSAYEIGGEEAASERTLGGLLQSQILKRFESCWAACLKTVARMLAAHEAFLVAWDSGVVPSNEALRAAAVDEIDGTGLATWVADALDEDPGSRPSDDFDEEFREHVGADQERLLEMHELLSALDADTDPKLALLRRLLKESPAEKIAVFATFGDTVEYLDEHLPDPVDGRARVTVIGSASDPDQRTAALARFSPHTVVRGDYEPPDGEVDLLLSTDVLSEGQNLQQAGGVISYDMPWNPQRVVQRNGRVIRLKSPHDDVYLTTMLPEEGDLETLLGLESTIRRKILAASIYGMESRVIDEGHDDQEGDTDLHSYVTRLVAGDTSLLDEDDATSGAFTGEGLRALLLRAAGEGELERIAGLPWGIGAAFRQGPGVPSRGEPGVFFACRTPGGQRYWRYVEPEGGEVVETEAEILRRIDPGTTPGVDVEATSVDLEQSWSRAVSSIVEEHNRRADPRFAEEQIGPVQRFALDLLADPNVLMSGGTDDAYEALAVERSSTVRHALGQVRSQLQEGLISRDEAAAKIVEVVEDFGLRAVEPPPPLEVITESDVGVVCWMAVLPAEPV